MAAKPRLPDENAMQNRPPKLGVPGHAPLAQGERPHLNQPAPAMRHSLKLGILATAALPAQSPHPLRQFLAVYMPAPAGLPEWPEPLALILEAAEAA